MEERTTVQSENREPEEDDEPKGIFFSARRLQTISVIIALLITIGAPALALYVQVQHVDWKTDDHIRSPGHEITTRRVDTLEERVQRNETTIEHRLTSIETQIHDIYEVVVRDRRK